MLFSRLFLRSFIGAWMKFVCVLSIFFAVLSDRSPTFSFFCRPSLYIIKKHGTHQQFSCASLYWLPLYKLESFVTSFRGTKRSWHFEKFILYQNGDSNGNNLIISNNTFFVSALGSAVLDRIELTFHAIPHIFAAALETLYKITAPVPG